MVMVSIINAVFGVRLIWFPILFQLNPDVEQLRLTHVPYRVNHGFPPARLAELQVPPGGLTARIVDGLNIGIGERNQDAVSKAVFGLGNSGWYPLLDHAHELV